MLSLKQNSSSSIQSLQTFKPGKNPNMNATFFILSLLYALTKMAAASPTTISPQSCCNETVSTEDWHAHIVTNYIKLWYGDLSVLKQTISPVMTFHGDRFPLSTDCSSGKGSAQIHLSSSEEFGAFVEKSRSGFEKYGFVADYWFGHENRVAIRWSLDAVIGKDYAAFPT